MTELRERYLDDIASYNEKHGEDVRRVGPLFAELRLKRFSWRRGIGCHVASLQPVSTVEIEIQPVRLRALGSHIVK